MLLWISILISHRFSKEEREENKTTINWLKEHFKVGLENYDVIIGYRADDSYFDYSRDFVTNNLSLEILKDAMRLGRLGNQFVLKSKRSFEHIKYIKHEYVKPANEYEVFRRKTKSEYYKIKKEDDINNTFIRDIMRKMNGTKGRSHLSSCLIITDMKSTGRQWCTLNFHRLKDLTDGIQ